MVIPVNDAEVVIVEDLVVQVRVLEDVIDKGNERFEAIRELQLKETQ